MYGYAGHWTTTQAAFPKAVEVETASVSESEMIDRKAPAIWETGAHTLTGDNSYCNLHQVRTWAKKGTVLLTPALKVSPDSPKGGPYKAFVSQPENAALLKLRKTATEPLFDLIAQLICLCVHLSASRTRQAGVKGCTCLPSAQAGADRSENLRLYSSSNSPDSSRAFR